MLTIGIYLAVVGLTSTLGNSLFIFVLRRRLRATHDGQTVLLLNAAVCDLCISLTGYPYSVVSSFHGRWVFGDLLCQMYGFLCFTLNEVQMNTLVVIAAFRYISVCQPQFKYLLTPGLALRCLVVVWMYCLVWTSAPLLGWSRYVQEPAGVSCSTDWHDRTPLGIAYSFCLVIFCFLIQLAALVLCYSKILRKSSTLQLRWPETNPRLFRVGEGDVQTEGLKCCRYYVCLCESNCKNGVEQHVLWVNLVMVLSFVTFWTPYAVVSLTSVFTSKLSTFWYIFPTVFAKTSCMMNPLIYGLSHKLLYRELCVLLRACRYCVCHGDHDRKEMVEMRRRLADGTHDKEGIYVGKVRVGVCNCNGCAMSRRDMIILARLQKNSNEDHVRTSGNNQCAISLVDEYLYQGKPKYKQSECGLSMSSGDDVQDEEESLEKQRQEEEMSFITH